MWIAASLLAWPALFAQPVPPAQPAPLAQDEGASAELQNEIYPAAQTGQVLRYYETKGDIDLQGLLSALGEIQVELVYGPQYLEARPGYAFIITRCPTEATTRELGRALKKGKAKVQELTCFAFRGYEETRVDFGAGLTTREFILGMSNDIRWYDASGDWIQFFCTPRKIDAEKIRDLYAKLIAPVDGAKPLGELARESFAWTMSRTPVEYEANKLLKQVRKLPNVIEATVTDDTLTVTVEFDDLAVSGPEQAFPDDDAMSLPRVCYSTEALFELLNEFRLLGEDE